MTDPRLMHGPELRGAHVLLRAPRADDLDALVAMYADPAIARWWHHYDQARIERELISPDDTETSWVIEVDGAIAGIVQYWEETEPDYRHAGIDIAVGVAWHGTGAAVDALATVAAYLIDELGHHRLTIDPAADNGRAIAAYAKVGFRPVGILRNNERGADGTWHDTLLMDLLPEELRRP